MASFSVARRPVESLAGVATIGLGWIAYWMNLRSNRARAMRPADSPTPGR
jgi:hypothetical protein